MYVAILTGTGAGLAAALLFAAVAAGSPLGMFLSYLAPLPIFIVTLGWRHLAGLAAAIVGALASLLLFNASAGLAFGLGIALPAWWLGYLSMLGRPDASGTTELYPTGRVLLWICLLAGVVTVLGAIAIGGGYAGYEAAMRSKLTALFGALGEGPDAPQGLDMAAIVDTLTTAAPILTAASFAPMQAFNLWLAGKIVSASGRLARPWPDVAASRMPPVALVLLAVACVLAIIGDGFVGFAGLALTGALAAAYALQCLGAIHIATRGKAARPFMLALIYALLIPFFAWMTPLLAAGGVIEALIRATRKGPPPHHPANDA